MLSHELAVVIGVVTAGLVFDVLTVGASLVLLRTVVREPRRRDRAAAATRRS
jgi:hypothetical protein